MDGFESIIAELLETEGYWVRPSFKVELTKAEKRRIGRPSAPRWELDIVAYRGSDSSVLVVECKSYLDSPGVGLSDLKGGRHRSRYKLFTEPLLRRTVLKRLTKQLVGMGLSAPSPSTQLALAAESRETRTRCRPTSTRMGGYCSTPHGSMTNWDKRQAADMSTLSQQWWPSCSCGNCA